MSEKLQKEVAVMSSCIESLRASDIDECMRDGICVQWDRLREILSEGSTE